MSVFDLPKHIQKIMARTTKIISSIKKPKPCLKRGYIKAMKQILIHLVINGLFADSTKSCTLLWFEPIEKDESSEFKLITGGKVKNLLDNVVQAIWAQARKSQRSWLFCTMRTVSYSNVSLIRIYVFAILL